LTLVGSPRARLRIGIGGSVGILNSFSRIALIGLNTSERAAGYGLLAQDFSINKDI
jgi:hypothetical protein